MFPLFRALWHWLTGGAAGPLCCMLALAGAPGWLLCEQHWCMEGHMKHPPYPWWHYASDVWWTACWLLAAVTAVFSPERRYWIVSLLIILCLAMRHTGFGGDVVPFYGLILFSAYGWIRTLGR